jgi:hypothetical protein
MLFTIESKFNVGDEVAPDICYKEDNEFKVVKVKINKDDDCKIEFEYLIETNTESRKWYLENRLKLVKAVAVCMEGR